MLKLTLPINVAVKNSDHKKIIASKVRTVTTVRLRPFYQITKPNCKQMCRTLNVCSRNLRNLYSDSLFYSKLNHVLKALTHEQHAHILQKTWKHQYHSKSLDCKKPVQNKTYPADCRKIAAVDSNKHDWDWTNRIYWKKRFLYKRIF